jgi:hypothetical protein
VRVASDEHLFGEVYRSRYARIPMSRQKQLLTVSRVRDWIHGVRSAAPDKVTRESLEAEPLYEAERLRIIYQLITNPPSEGGAGITPKEGEWENVESIFALHDHAYNKDWIKKWTSQYFLTTEDLDDIRNRLGEKVSFHNASFWGHQLTRPDCLLFRLYTILLHLPHSRCWVRLLLMALPGLLLAYLRPCECPMVYRLHRILETPGG